MSVAVEAEIHTRDGFPAFELPVDQVRGVLEVRAGGVDEGHVALLMETIALWPPILVWHDQGLIVDGAHRLEAARRLGHRTISAVLFVGTAEEAFVESVRRNVDHGLPLTIDDRRRAAVRVLSVHGDWSDSRIGVVCGLSGKSVARLRQKASQTASEPEIHALGAERRVGRDGKARPVAAGAVRDRIRLALVEHPTASLRTIARLVDASPETVRSVRSRLAHPDGRAPAVAPGVPRTALPPLPSEPIIGEEAVREVSSPAGLDDLAPADPGDGADFRPWFEAGQVDEDWHRFVPVIPINRIYDVVDEARRRASAWADFARVLETRVSRP